MRHVIYSLVGSVALFATGCVNILPEAPPPSARYTISAVDFDKPSEDQVTWSLACLLYTSPSPRDS